MSSAFITYAEPLQPGDRVQFQEWYLLRFPRIHYRTGSVLAYRGKRDVVKVHRAGVSRPELWRPDVWEKIR